MIKLTNEFKCIILKVKSIKSLLFYAITFLCVSPALGMLYEDKSDQLLSKGLPLIHQKIPDELKEVP